MVSMIKSTSATIGKPTFFTPLPEGKINIKSHFVFHAHSNYTSENVYPDGLKTELPDCIKKAWGISNDKITPAVFYSVLESRVHLGDLFIKSMNKARSGCYGDLWKASNFVPQPRCYKRGAFDYETLGLAALNPSKVSHFSNGHIPKTPLRTYCARLFQIISLYQLSPSIYPLVLLYLDRVFRNKPNIFLNSWNAHRLILGAFVVACKYHEDITIRQDSFAYYGRVSIHELNGIEEHFLKHLEFNCFISSEDFKKLEIDLKAEASKLPTSSAIPTVLKRTSSFGIAFSGQYHFKCQYQYQYQYQYYSPLYPDIKKKKMLVNALARALITDMFPGVPVDASNVPAQMQWKIWWEMGARFTNNQHFIYQSLLDIMESSSDFSYFSDEDILSLAWSSVCPI